MLNNENFDFKEKIPENWKVIYTQYDKFDTELNRSFKQDTLIIENIKTNEKFQFDPDLDPYLDINDNLVCLSSDGLIQIFDFEYSKILEFKIDIVLFYCNIRLDSNNNIVVEGAGCYWGFESIGFDYKLVVNRISGEIIDQKIEQIPEDEF